jgi:hypothetical protein
VKKKMQKLQGVTYNSTTGEPTFWQGQASLRQDGAATKIDGWGESVFRAKKWQFVLCGDLSEGHGTLTKIHERNQLQYEAHKTFDGRLVLLSTGAKGCLWIHDL